jgi:hypothetical protein
VSLESHILVQYFNITFLLTTFKESAGSVFLQLTDTSRLTDTFTACQKFYRLSELIGSDQQQMSDKIMSLHMINFTAQTTWIFYCCPQFLHTGANVVLRNICA